jgi:tRNA-splicing ligase RtcB
MNKSELRRLGVPESLWSTAIDAIRSASAAAAFSAETLPEQIARITAAPADHVTDPHFGALAAALMTAPPDPIVNDEPIPYRTWGSEIDSVCHQQMSQACRLPMAAGAALMPDAHVGYGLPIGGVLALRNAVVPYAVGVDIACRMKLSVLDVPPTMFAGPIDPWERALEKGTAFGVGGQFKPRKEHPVLDQDWNVCRITRQMKERAWSQLGTSGSGNHFVEFGLLTVAERSEELGLDAGEYVALLSHSGSRGTGAAVCNEYSRIATQRLPKHYEHLGRLAWLDLNSDAGAEYWAAMNLMGDYAAANHDVIHRSVTKLLGARIIAGVENHHNFAWKEIHKGEEWIVHRKGATPAGEGVLGVIPGSMGAPAFVVRGKGNAESLNSASHGAGRCMSRTAGLNTFRFPNVRKELAARGITVLSAGADESPGVYKDIHKVMAEQTDLVDSLARFDPKVVKMCGDNSKAED